jgi:hypothetical protein
LLLTIVFSSCYLYRVLLFAAIVAIANAGFLVANYYTDVATCSSGKSAQAMIPMGKCISIPEIPPSLNISVPIKSFKSECTQNADGSIATSNKAYATSSSCSGLGVPVKESIPAGCNQGGLFTCVNDMAGEDSVVGGWPAVGAYFGDSGCGAGNFDVQAAFLANTCVTLSGKKGSGSVIVTPTDTDFTAKAWQDATTCDGPETKSYSVPIGTCQAVDIPAMKAERHATLKAFHHLFTTALNLDVSPELVSWLNGEIEKEGLALKGGAGVFAKAGIAGKL